MPLRVKVGDEILEVPDGMNERNMALWIESHRKLQSPTTFGEGFHEGLKKEPVAGGAVGFAEGLPEGIKGGVKGIAQTPLWILKELVSTAQGAANLAKDPEGTINSVIEKYKGMPAEFVQGLQNYAQMARTDPEAFGRVVGNLTGNVETGIAASRAIPLAIKPVARQTGALMETVGKKGEWPIRMMGAHQLGSGNPLGVATMMLPETLQKGGAAIRAYGGQPVPPAMAAKLNSQFDEAMAKRNISFYDEQQKAAANAARAASIEEAKAGLKPTPPSIRETVSAETPEGRQSMTTRFTKEGEKTAGGLTPEQEDLIKTINARNEAIAAKEGKPAPKAVQPPPPEEPPAAPVAAEPTPPDLTPSGRGNAQYEAELGRAANAQPTPNAGVTEIESARGKFGPEQRAYTLAKQRQQLLESARNNPNPAIRLAPPSKFDQMMASTEVPADLSVEGAEGINPAPPRVGGDVGPRTTLPPVGAPTATDVPSEWLDAVTEKIKPTGSKSRYYSAHALSRNDVTEAINLYRQNPNIAPEEAASLLEQMRTGRRANYRDLGNLSALERQMLEREQE